ncbi:Single-stranded nucleic acid binding R3H protein putative isoform 1 [Tripterygium wilfordii]|uniref:Single-stranded nucleic acid binding R3H protein putative isoform 1 n=1 Tax=Tripterygium wilfordii TaxID=458696 RepID=A0A7J7DBT8_TRIWF|nr:Single-stranded nucleic acid binding R3H protein putative isoform 1 [Tripterygium wilfordii]
MSITEFAMVEELASLVRNNFPCKHLVLSVEEALVNFLQDDTSSNGILELEPMNPYNRLLLHRLADIFGFAHESVGEGDERHIILERCPETSIPSILVSDILGQYDDPQSHSISHHLLRRKDAPPVLKVNLPSSTHTLEEREVAYLAARERIFSADVDYVRDPAKLLKRRNSPVVARRMIAHALGQKINQQKPDITIEVEGQTNQLHTQNKDQVDTNHGFYTGQGTSASSLSERNMLPEAAENTCTNAGISQSGRTRNGIDKNNSKAEHLGAAKRMFANALGLNLKNGLPLK